MDREGKSKRERSRDVVAMMEKMLSKMENAEAFNSVRGSIKLDVQTKLDHFLAKLTSLRDEVKDVKGDWALCKEVVLNKTRTSKEPKVLDSFKPKSYNGKREVKELDTFLWNIERYFKYLKLEDDEPKINTATLFFTDNALMWWHRRSMEIEQEAIAAAESLVDFKKKDQGNSKFIGKKDSSGFGGGDNKPKRGSKSGNKSDSHKSSGKKIDKGDKGKDKLKLACYL
ncbi:hypothetical protein L3X38_036617 [Prunus dulcis]|uniref:Uncharacterized protein n=1 Tax=Prunus dulcis TaxID=3755 RepID=A0AAD4V1S4_PRUDU|nr:hypothetical protein L3X38_036617 [Prunus dulcis]